MPYIFEMALGGDKLSAVMASRPGLFYCVASPNRE